jgi:hypothetical protein
MADPFLRSVEQSIRDFCTAGRTFPADYGGGKRLDVPKTVRNWIRHHILEEIRSTTRKSISFQQVRGSASDPGALVALREDR